MTQATFGNFSSSAGWSHCARRFVPAFVAVVLAATAAAIAAGTDEPVVLTVRAEPLHVGRVTPLLFGNFIELLDDVVPGMWGEMFNDRNFEGVEPANHRTYYTGAPDICDRPWDPNASWAYDHQQPFNGAGCAKLTAAPRHPATLTQSGLAVGQGATYRFSGYFRSDDAAVEVSVALKTQLPDGSWMTLDSAALPKISSDWQKCAVSLTSSGRSDRTVFELQVEGRGHVWADKLSLMPADNVHGWRRDVIAVVRQLHPAIVRWGGSIIDPGQYRWENGVGDRDGRTPFRNQFWGHIDSNDVGIDEFCQFCEAVGAFPLICVSFGDGAESAANLVKYCNSDAATPWGKRRAANGHPAPYGVKYWQIGNEIAGDKPVYLEQIGHFIRLMKEADSTVQLMSSYPAQELLDAAGRDLAFVCPHFYTRDLAKMESTLRKLSKAIDDTAGCANLKIGVTEWNVSGGEWGLMRGRQMTLETALLNARQLHIMMRHSDKVSLATRSNMSNSFGGATFETNPAGVLKRPSHFVMDLYNRHARPVPLQIGDAPEGLDAFACATEDKKAVTVFVVNSGNEPVTLQLAGDGFAQAWRVLGAECVRDTQDARQIDLMNHWTAPERVKNVPLPVAENRVTLPALSVTAIECAAGNSQPGFRRPSGTKPF